jgi:hypothetical protein
MTDSSRPLALDAARESAETAIAIARAIDEADLISACLDALAAINLADDRVAEALASTKERLVFADRLTTAERVDASIMTSWTLALLGDLDGSQKAAAEVRAGLSSGQAPGWSLGASAWRVFALHALGRWDDAVLELQRADISWQESQLRAPWFALNGFMAGLAIGRARADTVAVDRWRGAALTIFERSDPAIRTQSLRAFVDDDLPQLEELVLRDFDRFAGRLDYVYLTCLLLGDRRYPASKATLDELIEYADARSQLLTASQARRLRGIVAQDPDDLRVALTAFESMGARPSAARATTEIGLLTGDTALVERGLAELERIGDLEQMSRVGAELRGDGPGEWPAGVSGAARPPSGIMGT